jgi:predicted RNA binding protein YcfA (HicA-like mRNA interferase family)
MKSSKLLHALLKANWKLDRVNGAHHIFIHPNHADHVVLLYPEDDLGKGLVHKIVCKTELKKEDF